MIKSTTTLTTERIEDLKRTLVTLNQDESHTVAELEKEIRVLEIEIMKLKKIDETSATLEELLKYTEREREMKREIRKVYSKIEELEKLFEIKRENILNQMKELL